LKCENGLIALRRAACKARELTEQTGTPFYVLPEGKIVDLTAEKKARSGKPNAAED
jgi:hypothetical protein